MILNNQELAQLFSTLPFGTEMRHRNNAMRPMVFVGVSANDSGEPVLCLKTRIDAPIRDYYAIEEWMPVLKSVNDLTDSFELALAAGYLRNSFPKQYLEEVGHGIANGIVTNSYSGSLDILDLLNVIDKLRSLGYMVPFKGYDLFESKIAIDKAKTTSHVS